jgi:hypothetical protein
MMPMSIAFSLYSFIFIFSLMLKLSSARCCSLLVQQPASARGGRSGRVRAERVSAGGGSAECSGSPGSASAPCRLAVGRQKPEERRRRGRLTQRSIRTTNPTLISLGHGTWRTRARGARGHTHGTRRLSALGALASVVARRGSSAVCSAPRHYSFDILLSERHCTLHHYHIIMHIMHWTTAAWPNDWSGGGGGPSWARRT